MNGHKVLKRITALIATLALVILVNVAISYAAKPRAPVIDNSARSFDVVMHAGSNQLIGNIPRP